MAIRIAIVLKSRSGENQQANRLVLAMTTAGIELVASLSPLGSWSDCDGD
jgi:hypothetical protein